MMKEPEKIMKKNILNGQIKYQVKWKGFDETTWESDETMKKYKELIEDYNYFSLTGERYDEKLEEIRQLTVQSQPRTAIKRVAMPKLMPPNKIDSKHVEIIDNPKNDLQQDQANILQLSNTTINLTEISKKAPQKLANSNDKLESIKLQTDENRGLFSLIWKERSDGIRPYCDEYNYEDFKIQAPLFLFSF